MLKSFCRPLPTTGGNNYRLNSGMKKINP